MEAIAMNDTGARVTFTEMMRNPHSPQDVPQETFHPVIHRAVTNPGNMQVLPAGDVPQEQLPAISLMRQDNPQQAYAAVDPQQFVKMDHHAPNWGKVYFAVVYQHVGGGMFQAPTQAEAQLVAIKQLNKRVVERYLQLGGEENPYKEIDRLQRLGDDVHVLKCIEALEDDDYLYIMTRKGQRLVDVIFGSDALLPPARTRAIFKKLLLIIGYLGKHEICHRDFSPDNFLFLSEDLDPANLVVYDMALSHRLPVVKGQRVLARPNGNFGTHAYMPTEIYRNQPGRFHGQPQEIFDKHAFCGLFGDLWSSAVILYNLLVRNVVCLRPWPDDNLFLYNIVAQGLSRAPLNERVVELLQDFNEREDVEDDFIQGLGRRAMAHLNLDPEAIEVLENLLRLNPHDRWTLAEAWGSAYCTRADGGV